MAQARRVRLTASQRIEVWGRWKQGQSLHEIGRAVGKNHRVIHVLLARDGGIAPPARRRSPVTLTLAEREDISRGIASGSSLREIAVTGWSFCTRASERVYITARPCETELGGTRGL
jgi:IS30 family transposase